MARKPIKVIYQRPNNKGSITDVSKSRPNIRNPFMARINVGHKFDKNGKKVPDRKLLGYYATYEEAEAAINNYLEIKENEGSAAANELVGKKESLLDIWDAYVEERTTTENLSRSRMSGFRSTRNYLEKSNLGAKRLIDIDIDTLKKWYYGLEKKNVGIYTRRRIYHDLCMLYDYADIENKARKLKPPPRPDKDKTVFTKDQMLAIWKMKEDIYSKDVGRSEIAKQKHYQAKFAVDSMLILLYCGCRIEELLSVKTSEVNISLRFFDIRQGKNKTSIRRVPIHSAVFDIWQEYYEPKNEYMFTNPFNCKKHTYANYRDSYWDQLVEALGFDLKVVTPHITRRTFISYAEHYCMKKNLLDHITGHTGNLTVDDRYYLRVPVSDLIKEMEKIPKDYNKLINLYDEYLLV